MGEKIDRLIALAGRVHVSGYERTSTLGNVTHVDPYWRSPSKMSSKEIADELSSLTRLYDENTAYGQDNTQTRNRMQQLRNEQRKRGTAREPIHDTAWHSPEQASKRYEEDRKRAATMIDALYKSRDRNTLRVNLGGYSDADLGLLYRATAPYRDDASPTPYAVVYYQVVEELKKREQEQQAVLRHRHRNPRFRTPGSLLK